jgi:hypothetical protein
MHFRAKMIVKVHFRAFTKPIPACHFYVTTSPENEISDLNKRNQMSKKLEDLPPLSLQISELLSRRAADLLNLIKIKEHALKNAPAGSVRIVQRRNNVLQFYRKQSDMHPKKVTG